MTLEAIFENGAQFALNEITGRLLKLDRDDPHKTTAWIPGDTSPLAMCSLLFDKKHVDENWSPISNCEAIRRHQAYHSPDGAGAGICGCISVDSL